MEKILQRLQGAALFKGFTQEEIVSALLCLNGTIRHYERKQAIYSGDEPMDAIGLVLKGMVFVSKADEAGGQAIFFGAAEGELIGEASLQRNAALGPEETGDGQAFSITAAEACEILFIRPGRIASGDRPESACALRGRVIENLLALLVANNNGLYRRLDLVANRSLRSRIMRYLEQQAGRHRARSFAIPFSRADFADYLLVDRSALSRELGRMAADGLIAFTRNRFELLERDHTGSRSEAGGQRR